MLGNGNLGHPQQQQQLKDLWTLYGGLNTRVSIIENLIRDNVTMTVVPKASAARLAPPPPLPVSFSSGQRFVHSPSPNRGRWSRSRCRSRDLRNRDRDHRGSRR